ncbi:hypothetical protein Tco_0471485 [Tanacetum coccineum]
MFVLAFKDRTYSRACSTCDVTWPLCQYSRGGSYDTSELVEDDEDGDEEDEDEEVEESSDSDSKSEDAEDEGPTAEGKGPAVGGEGLAAGDESPGMRVESLGLGGDEAVPEGQQQVAPVMETTMVGQGSGSVPEPERPERVSALRQPTLTTWIDPKDDRVYIDVPAYLPFFWSYGLGGSGSVPEDERNSHAHSPFMELNQEWEDGRALIDVPVFYPTTSTNRSRTPPSPKFLYSRHHCVVMISILITPRVSALAGCDRLIHDHTVRLGELSPTLFKRYDMDIWELFTRSKAVRDEIFTQRYRLRSLDHEAALWHAIGDTQIENQELRLQIAEETRARLDLAEIVASMRRGHEPRGDV